MENKDLRLQEFSRLAHDAYSGTSFDPDKRGKDTISSYSDQLENDLSKIPAAEQERYIANYKKYFSAMLGSRVGIFSTMIAGPSNFPVSRMEKKNRTADKRYEEFVEWRERALKAIEKNRLASRSENEVNDDMWNQIKKHMTSSATVAMNLDLGIERGYNRTLFVNSIVGTVKTLAKNGRVDLVKRAQSYIKELNEIAVGKGANEIVTNRHSVWKLGEVAEVVREQKVDEAVKENEIEMITDIEIVKNYKVNRLQILFPTKPNDEIRNKMKARAFRWSPNEGAWQRQLTRDAEYAIKQIFREVGILNETNDPEMLGRMAIHG